jgi:hypothetical protein
MSISAWATTQLGGHKTEASYRRTCRSQPDIRREFLTESSGVFLSTHQRLSCVIECAVEIAFREGSRLSQKPVVLQTKLSNIDAISRFVLCYAVLCCTINLGEPVMPVSSPRLCRIRRRFHENRQSGRDHCSSRSMCCVRCMCVCR